MIPIIIVKVYLLCVSVSGIDFSYTKVGYVDVAGNKVHCLNDCRNNLCIIDNTLQEYRCTPGSTLAPVSYTYQKKSSNVKCLSRCDYTHTTYSWCYVTQSGTWDYCNGNYAAHWVRDQRYTLREGPCMSECVLNRCDGTNCKYRCEHFWSSSDDCSPTEGYDYVQANVQNGGQCRGRCFYHDGYSYQWCYYGSSRQWDRCAPPTLPRRVSWRQRLVDFALPKAVERLTPELILSNRTMSKLISDILYDHTLMIVNVHNAEKNPVYKYAHELQKNGNKSPVLVKAEVRPHHLQEAHERSGLLVGASLGGPKEAYNTVPQHRPVATAHFESEEREVRNFLIRQTAADPRVKIDVVAVNKANADRPIAFLVHTQYYLGEDLNQEYCDIVPNV